MREMQTTRRETDLRVMRRSSVPLLHEIYTWPGKRRRANESLQWWLLGSYIWDAVRTQCELDWGCGGITLLGDDACLLRWRRYGDTSSVRNLPSSVGAHVSEAARVPFKCRGRISCCVFLAPISPDKRRIFGRVCLSQFVRHWRVHSSTRSTVPMVGWCLGYHKRSSVQYWGQIRCRHSSISRKPQVYAASASQDRQRRLCKEA